ncbi:MAG: phosphohydrolase [Siphonobacter sp.]
MSPMIPESSPSAEADKVVKKENCENHANCMKLIQMVLDGEASAEEYERVCDNIGKCIPCERGYNLEKAIKQALQLRVEKKVVPQSLKDCIKDKIKSIGS